MSRSKLPSDGSPTRCAAFALDSSTDSGGNAVKKVDNSEKKVERERRR
jgi:hypothetical protein